MKTIHAFFDKNQQLRHPVLAVDSYGLPDLFASKTTWPLLELEFKEISALIEKDDGEVKHHIVLGILLRNAAKKLTAATIKKIIPIDAQRTIRPMHYSTNKNQTVEWVDAPSPGDDILGVPFAMLCDEVRGGGKNITIHASASDAATAAISEVKSSGQSFPCTGNNHTYFGYFGGSVDFIRHHIKFEDVLSEQKIDLLDDAHDAFRKVQYQGYCRSLQKEILKRSQVGTFGLTTLKNEQGEAIAIIPTRLISLTYRSCGFSAAFKIIDQT